MASEDITLTGQLVGQKAIASEFVGYESLATMKATGAFTYQRSIMATHAMRLRQLREHRHPDGGIGILPANALGSANSVSVLCSVERWLRC